MMLNLVIDITYPVLTSLARMRTTINLDDEVLESVSRYAKSRSVSLGRAVSDLVRKGLETRRPTRLVNGLQVFDLPGDSPKVTCRKVRELESKPE